MYYVFVCMYIYMYVVDFLWKYSFAYFRNVWMDILCPHCLYLFCFTLRYGFLVSQEPLLRQELEDFIVQVFSSVPSCEVCHLYILM